MYVPGLCTSEQRLCGLVLQAIRAQAGLRQDCCGFVPEENAWALSASHSEVRSRFDFRQLWHSETNQILNILF